MKCLREINRREWEEEKNKAKFKIQVAELSRFLLVVPVL